MPCSINRMRGFKLDLLFDVEDEEEGEEEDDDDDDEF